MSYCVAMLTILSLKVYHCKDARILSIINRKLIKITNDKRVLHKMKTATISQTYLKFSRSFLVSIDVKYKNRRILHDSYDSAFDTGDTLTTTFEYLLQLGFTHWKSDNGCIGIRKIPTMKASK